MNVRRFTVPFEYSLVGVLVLVCCWSSRAMALAGHEHATPDRTKTTSALIDVVRQATERFKDVKVAEGEEYGLLFGCVSGSDSGAMGLHYVKQALLMDGDIDPANPEIVIYEPVPNGPPRLIGADYLVFKDAWDAKHPEGPPQMMGQLFHLFESPIASDSSRSTPCTSGRGRTTPTARS